MVKPLKRVKREIYYFDESGNKVFGPSNDISGDVSGISGDERLLVGWIVWG